MLISFATRRLLPLFTAIAVAVTANAQDRPAAGEKTSLWRVSGGTSTVYLLASIHVLKATDHPLPKAFDRAFDHAEVVVFEINLDQTDPVDLQMMTLSRARYEGGERLEGHLSKTTYETLREWAARRGVNIDQLQHFEPWFLDMTITLMHMQQLGFDPQYGVDKYFLDRAKKANKTIVGLETVDYQIDRMDGLSDKAQEAMLLKTLAELDTFEKEFQHATAGWRKGDLQAMDALMLKGLKENPELYQRLVVERNRNWIPKMEELLKGKQTVLVVVGAGHLVGKDSLIELLKEKGYRVEQL